MIETGLEEKEQTELPEKPTSTEGIKLVGTSWLSTCIENLVDPFAVHFEQDLSEGEVEELEAIFSEPLEYQHSLVRVLPHGGHLM